MQKMTEVKGSDAIKIKSIAKRFDDAFSECFDDLLMRAAIWTEPGDDNLILVKVLASNYDGNFVAYIGQYQVDVDAFFCDKKMSKAFMNDKCREKAEQALIRFVSEITKMRFAINKILLDLNVRSYYTVKVGHSDEEEGSIVLHICTYSDQAKDDYGITDTRNLVGEELATF